MILDQIVQSKKRQLANRQKQVPVDVVQKMLAGLPAVRDFKAALVGPSVKLIAEVKRASPSKGLICRDFDPLRIARAYTENGAAAISVLTETEFFQGNLDYITQISASLGGVCPPLLRKDFIFDHYQIYESRAYGADAVLLIAAILSFHQLKEMLALSHEIGLVCLVEIHNEDEAAKAVMAGAGIIGINNRDLQNFEVNLETTARLRSLIPAGKVVVSESGIKNRQDIQQLRSWGVNAALVGETLISAPSISLKMKELL